MRDPTGTVVAVTRRRKALSVPSGPKDHHMPTFQSVETTTRMRTSTKKPPSPSWSSTGPYQRQRFEALSGILWRCLPVCQEVFGVCSRKEKKRMEAAQEVGRRILQRKDEEDERRTTYPTRLDGSFPYVVDLIAEGFEIETLQILRKESHALEKKRKREKERKNEQKRLGRTGPFGCLSDRTRTKSHDNHTDTPHILTDLCMHVQRQREIYTYIYTYTHIYLYTYTCDGT